MYYVIPHRDHASKAIAAYLVSLPSCVELLGHFRQVDKSAGHRGVDAAFAELQQSPDLRLSLRPHVLPCCAGVDVPVFDQPAVTQQQQPEDGGCGTNLGPGHRRSISMSEAYWPAKCALRSLSC
jgi:hypothetical protein